MINVLKNFILDFLYKLPVTIPENEEAKNAAVILAAGVIALLFLFVLGIISNLISFIKRRIQFSRYKKEVKQFDQYIQGIVVNSTEITPQELQHIRKGRNRSRYSNQLNVPGAYVLYNYTTDMHYVGQSIRILDRVHQHFRGGGSPDVYTDYRYGHNFTIKMVPLIRSGFSNLNDLERYLIQAFNSFGRGYNKTRGNRS